MTNDHRILISVLVYYLYIFDEYLAIANLVIELTITLLSKSCQVNKLNLLIHSIIMIFYLNLPNDFFLSFFFPFWCKLFLMVFWYFLLIDLYAIFFYDILYSDPWWRHWWCKSCRNNVLWWWSICYKIPQKYHNLISTMTCIFYVVIFRFPWRHSNLVISFDEFSL